MRHPSVASGSVSIEPLALSSSSTNASGDAGRRVDRSRGTDSPDPSSATPPQDPPGVPSRVGARIRVVTGRRRGDGVRDDRGRDGTGERHGHARGDRGGQRAEVAGGGVSSVIAQPRRGEAGSSTRHTTWEWIQLAVVAWRPRHAALWVAVRVLTLRGPLTSRRPVTRVPAVAARPAPRRPFGRVSRRSTGRR